MPMPNTRPAQPRGLIGVIRPPPLSFDFLPPPNKKKIHDSPLLKNGRMGLAYGYEEKEKEEKENLDSHLRERGKRGNKGLYLV